MNKERLERLKEAAKYQKMAVRALLPERAAEHIEVIEKELQKMVMECVADMVFHTETRSASSGEGDAAGNESGTVRQENKSERVKKVSID